MAAVLVAALPVSGCGEVPAVPTSVTAPTLSSTTTLTPASSETPTPSSTTAPVTTVSPTTAPARITYAKSLGGTPHKGETLFFVVGATVDTEQKAQTLLDGAQPSFGDMQSYFIVEQSDNFDGMEPGGWVVIETYRKYPSAENLDFDHRAFPDAYVVRAKVKTDDPIPVYEDLVGP